MYLDILYTLKSYMCFIYRKWETINYLIKTKNVKLNFNLFYIIIMSVYYFVSFRLGTIVCVFV